MSERVYEFGPFRLDADKPALWRAGGVVFDVDDRPGEAHELLKALERLESTAFVSPYHLGVVRLALGERGRALDELERAADERDPWVVFASADSALAGLRGERRFETLVARVNRRP